MLLKKRFNLICGHYGCGKTNLSLNLALEAAKSGQKVTLVDMDLVNPYFRSSDYAAQVTRDIIKYHYGLAEEEDLITGTADAPDAGISNEL